MNKLVTQSRWFHITARCFIVASVMVFVIAAIAVTAEVMLNASSRLTIQDGSTQACFIDAI